MDDGSSIEGDQKIGEAMVDYFRNIFTSAALSNFNQILQGIETKVMPQMNSTLTQEYTATEVEHALKYMKPLSGPCLDDMSPTFYKSFWNIIGPNVVEASLSVLNTGTIPANFNHTFISLIPKIKNPEKAKNFRPISQCNMLYKIIAKTIANHFKTLLPKLVSET